VLLLATCLAGCTAAYPAKTPKGIDVDPIYAMQLAGDVKDVESIRKLLPSGTTYRAEKGSEMLIIIPPHAPQSGLSNPVFRSVEIYRSDTRSAARTEYEDNKRTFTRGDWKLYQEQGSDSNKYFSAYKAPWMNTNHGIPVGVITSPEILIGFLKENVVIIVSYTAYRDDTDYVKEVNEDILWVSDLLKRSQAPAVGRPAGP
jgi:hypothetical protein